MAGEGEPRKVSTCLVLRTSPAAVHRLAAAADVPCGPKKIARKKERAGRRTTRIMNTYACRGGTSFTARHDREEIGPVKEDTPRDTIRARARPPRLPSRCSRRCNATEIIVHSSSTSSSSPSLSSSAVPLLAFVLFLALVFSLDVASPNLALHLHTTPRCCSPKHLGSSRWNILLRVIKATLIDKFVSLGEATV